MQEPFIPAVSCMLSQKLKTCFHPSYFHLMRDHLSYKNVTNKINLLKVRCLVDILDLSNNLN